MSPQTGVRLAPDTTGPEGVDEEIFAPILQRVMAAETAYLRLGQLTESAPDYQEPELFCRSLLEDVLPPAHFPGPERDRFFAWAVEERTRARLLPVMASQDHLNRGDKPAARRYAERALSVNELDLYAQRLHRLAHGQLEPDLRGRFCSHPFDNFESYPRGEVRFCCPAWLPVPIGNLERQSAEEIWNSRAAQDIRRSILDGSYRYCSRMHCPKITACALPKIEGLSNQEHRGFVASRRTQLARGPRRLVLNHDRSCNLSCPSCRTKMIVARKPERERMNAMADRVLMPLLEHARTVHVTGSGDPFGSAHFRYLLRQIGRKRPPHLRLELQTNGLLLAQSWGELGLEGLVQVLYISIDAARPETYAQVRRGGSFERLLDNLAFVAELRRVGKVGRVRLDFVVQTLNFREMPEAVGLVRRFGFDGLKFQMIRSWNTYSPDEFAWHNIGSPDHPRFAEFLEVLRDPRLCAGLLEFWGFSPIALAALRGRGGAAEAARTIEESDSPAGATEHAGRDDLRMQGSESAERARAAYSAGDLGAGFNTY
jgi:MoaA/NifB/PqqE/SkfB family radical SAM enzyme